MGEYPQRDFFISTQRESLTVKLRAFAYCYSIIKLSRVGWWSRSSDSEMNVYVSLLLLNVCAWVYDRPRRLVSAAAASGRLGAFTTMQCK